VTSATGELSCHTICNFTLQLCDLTWPAEKTLTLLALQSKPSLGDELDSQPKSADRELSGLRGQDCLISLQIQQLGN